MTSSTETPPGSRANGSGELTPTQASKLQRQLDVWRRELVTLDRRQRLLYFKHTRSASLEVGSPSIADLLRVVEEGRSPVEAAPEGGEVQTAGTGRRRVPVDPIVVGNKSVKDLPASLRRLDQQSQQVYADRGFWTLYVGLGFLRWVDPQDGKPAESPIVLLPVRLKRGAAHEPFVLARTEDEVLLNPALQLKLETDFDITLPTPDPDDFDVEAYLRAVRPLIGGRSGWSVEARAVLTTFSFHKEAIYRDLLEHEEQVLAHPLVQLVALGPDSPSAGTFAFDAVEDEDLDRVVAPEQLVSILDADGSQRKSILAARDGRSFVMDGPPGTGKSQTIANIIVELIAAGRTVLFVSEKAAALDVVRKRLAAAQLSPFLLELHSHAATRKAVVMELNRALTQSVTASRHFTQADEATLASSRGELTSYAAATNERRSGLEQTLFSVLGRLAALHHVGGLVGPNGDQWAELDAATFSAIRAHGERLARAWRPLSEGDYFLWRDVVDTDVAGAAVERMGRLAATAGEAVAALRDTATAVDDDLGVSFGKSLHDAARRRDLLQHVEAMPPAVLPGWLTLSAEEFGQGQSRALQLEQATNDYKVVAARLAREAGAHWQQLNADHVGVVGALTDARDRGWAPGPKTATSRLQSLVAWLESSPTRLAAMQESSRRLAAMLGVDLSSMSLVDARRLTGLALLGQGTALPEAFWLHPSIQAALDESAHVLGGLVTAVRERELIIAETFTREALDLDLATLDVRFRETHTGLRRWSSQARADRKALRAVATSGKVDGTVLARLGEAVAWQRAERALNAGEQDHADRLGSYYRGTDTDFGRVARAIDVAHQAVRLAGEDLNGKSLAQQLALGGAPDPALTTVGHRLDDELTRWLAEGEHHLGAFAGTLSDRDLLSVAEWCIATADALRPGLAALEQVATVVQRDLAVAEARQLLERAQRAAELNAGLFDSYDDDLARLGEAYQALDTDWPKLTAALDWATTARELLAGPVARVVADRVLRPTLTAADVSERLQFWARARESLLGLFEQSRADGLRQEFSDDLSLALELTEELAETAVRDIELWCEHVRVREWLESHGFTETIQQMAERGTPVDDIPHAIERAALLAWTDATVKRDRRLRQYRSADRDALVTTFQQLDNQLVAEAHAAVINACSARRPRSANSKAAQLIRREAQKKSRHKAIREVLTEAASVVQELKPCLMMSPLSVSQYLPAGMRFDAVIFDEASQVLPSDAVNCIYRGGQLIVAGDQKQLPPTNFFAQSVDDELADEDEEEQPDRFESVLDVSKAAGALPSLPLLWHYRSQHESLITYSNYSFYDGELHTFPGAVFEAPDLGVQAYFVNGVYRRGGSRDNPIEAEAVVDRLLYHRTNHPEQSIGVVTFSAAQEDAIVAAIEQRELREPALVGLLSEQDRLDGFFVKSLENVQGDERDVILFSVGYGPDEAGKFTNTFGPLNREGGWRRLNVAITRARRRVEVLASFRPGQMQETTNKGVLHLRRYLDFAERGMPALALELSSEGRDTESPFEEDVLRVIQSLGYRATPQVGAAGYRIDLAVQHPDMPGEYVLAVECDGAAYHSAKAARDRDRLRQQVLENLGWTVHRIWGLSWVRDRAGQIARLQVAIEAAIRGVKPAAAVAPRRQSNVVLEEIDLEAPPAWAVPYEPGTAWGKASPERCPYEPQAMEARPYLRRYFERLIRVEAPVHEDRLLAAFRDDWGVGRVGRLIRENIAQSLSRATIDGNRVMRDEAGFHRISGDQLSVVRVPVDVDDIRPVGQVPPEEIELAVIGVVGDARELDDELVGQAVARLFGWRRQGFDIQAAVASACSRLLDRGRLSRTTEGGLRVTSD